MRENDEKRRYRPCDFAAGLCRLELRLRAKGNGARGRSQDRQPRRLRSGNRKGPANHPKSGSAANNPGVAGQIRRAGSRIDGGQHRVAQYGGLHRDAKEHGSSDYQNWLKGLDTVRKIVSDSLYTEW